MAGYLQIFLDLIGEELVADVLFREAVGGRVLVYLLWEKCLTMGIGDIQYSAHGVFKLSNLARSFLSN